MALTIIVLLGILSVLIYYFYRFFFSRSFKKKEKDDSTITTDDSTIIDTDSPTSTKQRLLLPPSPSPPESEELVVVSVPEYPNTYTTYIHLYPEKYSNYNALLQYATNTKNLPNLKHVRIDFMETTTTTTTDILQPSVLKSFLFARQNLVSFELNIVQRTDGNHFNSIINWHDTLQPLAYSIKLQKLILNNISFDTRDLTNLLLCVAPTLRVLVLEDMQFNNNEDEDDEDDQLLLSLILEISHMKQLVKLTLKNVSNLHDVHLQMLLPRLLNLRILSLAATTTTNNNKNNNRSNSNSKNNRQMLTDVSIRTITQFCPNLQSLDLSHQRQLKAISELIKGCTQLRELNVTGVPSIATRQLPMLLAESNTLLLFVYTAPTASSLIDTNVYYQQAMVVTEGRTLIVDAERGIIMTDSHTVKATSSLGVELQQRRTKLLLQQMQERTKNNPDIINEWENVLQEQWHSQ